MRKNTEQVLNAFRACRVASPCRAIWTDGHTIYSYDTPIAKHSGFGFVDLNMTKYSTTTTIHQNGLRVGLEAAGFTVTETDEAGVQ